MEAWQSKAGFVITVRELPDVTSGRLAGRIEHIASYRSSRFESVGEMVAFIVMVLTDVNTRDQSQ